MDNPILIVDNLYGKIHQNTKESLKKSTQNQGKKLLNKTTTFARFVFLTRFPIYQHRKNWKRPLAAMF